MKRTYSPHSGDYQPSWHLIDVGGQILGRAATQIAVWLMGKHQPGFARHMDSGDHVVVINAAGVKATGKKEQQKVYTRHTGYPGGLRQIVLEKLRLSKPEEIIKHAVAGMLPDNKLKKEMLKRLHVYAADVHPYGQHFK